MAKGWISSDSSEPNTKYICAHCGHVDTNIVEAQAHQCKEPDVTPDYWNPNDGYYSGGFTIPKSIEYKLISTDEFQALLDRIAALEARLAALEGDGK